MKVDAPREGILIVLEKAGLIERQRLGREHRCQLAPEPLRRATAWLEHYRNFWESRLDALERHLVVHRKQHNR